MSKGDGKGGVSKVSERQGHRKFACYCIFALVYVDPLSLAWIIMRDSATSAYGSDGRTARDIAYCLYHFRV